MTNTVGTSGNGGGGGGAEDDARSPEVILTYYRRLFPFKSFFLWLNQEHVPTRLWTHREFAFTLGESTYVRYNSFNAVEDFKKEILRANPTRFEIGPVYNARPRDRKTLQPNALRPEQRELVFDIDMTDYDEIRTCCSGGAICRKCWGYIAAAVKVLDHTLREQFAFRHLLWVYSGRRGIHCWISDRTALTLTDDQRRALVQFLEVVKGSKETVKRVNVRAGPSGDALHPAAKQAVDDLKLVFVTVCLSEQDCFREEKHWETLLALLPLGADTTAELRSRWQRSDRSSVNKWKDIMAIREDLLKKNPTLEAKLGKALEDLILQYTYPRIDAEVSKKRNHLLKSPFVIHPGTGRVCVPVDPDAVDDFDPEVVPTVGQVLRELDRPSDDVDMDVKRAGGDWDRTSLKPYVAMFDRHITRLMRENRDLKKARGGELSMEF